MTAAMLKMPAMREGAARQYPLGGVQTADQVADVMAWLLGGGATCIIDTDRRCWCGQQWMAKNSVRPFRRQSIGAW